jgi:hypothetical protein
VVALIFLFIVLTTGCAPFHLIWSDRIWKRTTCSYRNCIILNHAVSFRVWRANTRVFDNTTRPFYIDSQKKDPFILVPRIKFQYHKLKVVFNSKHLFPFFFKNCKFDCLDLSSNRRQWRNHYGTVVQSCLLKLVGSSFLMHDVIGQISFTRAQPSQKLNK